MSNLNFGDATSNLDQPLNLDKTAGGLDEFYRTAGAAAVSETIGEISYFSGATAPANYIELDGSAISRTTYADLYAVIGDTYGAGDGSTTFNLPDVSGQFARFYDPHATVDTDAASRTGGNVVGSKQTDINLSHRHSMPLGNVANNVAGGKALTRAASSFYSAYTGDTENRPININLMMIMRYAV